MVSQTLLVRFSIQNEFIEASCSSGDNTKIDFQEVELGDMDWIEPAQDRYSWWVLVNAVMNLRVLQSAENFLTS